jgi:hypothetical protein
MRPAPLIPLLLLAIGVLAGRFVWPRQRGIPEDEKARVNAAWAAAAQDTGFSESALTQRPAQPELAKIWDFLQRLESTPVSEFPALWAELEAAGNENQGLNNSHSSAEILFAERWAELDPEAAFAFFAEQGDQNFLIAAIFRTWARMNVETALAAVTAEKDENRRGAALAGIFNAAAENPANLIAWGRRLSFIDTSKLEPAHFDRVIPPDALRRAFESDPAGVRELAASMPAWFRLRLDALETARELATDLPAALARMDAASLTKQNATSFLLDMMPLLESHPEKLPAVIAHLTAKLGPAWMDLRDSDRLMPLLTALATTAPDKVRSLLHQAGRDSIGVVLARAHVAAELFATDPRLALQVAPPGDTWVSDFTGGPLLPPGAAGPPEQALELVRTAPSSTMRDSLLHEALTSLMKSSPDAAAAWVSALPPGELQDTARVTLDHSDYNPAQLALERAAASAAHGGENAASLGLVQAAAKRLLANDPAAATAQIMSWPASPARDAALETSGREWANAATPEALDWVESLPADAKSRALGGVMQSWAAAEPAEASGYLAALPSGPSRDAPAAGFARGLAEVDPASALLWGVTVQDPALRATTLRDVAERWLREDPDSAREGLASIPGLTQLERTTLATASPIPPP